MNVAIVLPVIAAIFCRYSRPVFAQTHLRLVTEPQFVFLKENLTTGSSLPRVSLCADYTARRTLALILTNGDPLDHFKLQRSNNTCWTLILKKALDADELHPTGRRGQSFSLTFRITDGRLQSFGSLDIQVTDLNDNPPRFIDTPSSIQILENTTVGTSVLRLTTFDPDTGVGGIDSFTLKTPNDGTFQLQNGSCESAKCTADLFLMRKLNYDLKNVYTVEVISFDGAGRIARVNTARFPMVINILDVQNKPPIFVTDKKIQHVSEDAKVNEPLFRIQAIDGDVGVSDPNPIEYYIENEIGNLYFQIDKSTGWVSAVRPLNREDPMVLKHSGGFPVKIVVKAVPDPRPNSVLDMTVVIDDVNDEPPRCNASSYAGRVTENAQRLIPVSFTSAKELYVYDNDEGTSGQFEVTLEGDHGTFDVQPKIVFNKANLLIRVKNSTALDFEKRKQINFKVILTEKSSGDNIIQGSCDVTVYIDDVNDNPPFFNNSKYEFAVLENLPSGTMIDTIPAYEADSGKFLPMKYSIEGAGSENFDVDEKGTIRTANELNREMNDVYRLNFVAKDENGAGLSTAVPLEIKVIDQNDHAPTFEQNVYTVYLMENSHVFAQHPSGLFVKATDADQAGSPNTNITYTFVTGYGTNNFTINPVSGRIDVAGRGIDLESMQMDHFNLTALAKDDGKPKSFSSVAHLVIYVNDSNDNFPIFQQPRYDARVFENATAGEFVVRVHATDADRSQFNHKIAYRIIDIQDKFVIDSQTGAISIAKGASLDRDRTGSDEFRLSILALDQGYPQRTSTCEVYINVGDINDKAPVFGEKQYNVRVSENAHISTILFNFSAFDADSTHKLQYSISGFQDAQTGSGNVVDIDKYNYTTLFAIGSETGQLRTAGALDREMMESVKIIILATDLNAERNIPQSAQTSIIVYLLDVNDNAPTFSKPVYRHTVKENAQAGTRVMSVSATDPDKNHTITYSLKSDSNLISVSRSTGEITVTGLIDFEDMRWLNFSVLATDDGAPRRTTEAPVYLEVADENDNSPVFWPSPSYAASITENSLVGTTVIRVNATDRDSGINGKVSYFILMDRGTIPLFTIDPDTGVITVAANLNRELKRHHTLTVQANDAYDGRINPNSHEATAIVEITITDVNDNPPAFSSATPKLLELQENNRIGLRIHQFSASDPDDTNTGNGIIRYFLSGGNATVYVGGKRTEMFRLNAQDGVLSLNTNLTGHNGNFYVIVEARDLSVDHPMSSNITVLVHVKDFNDHAPVIISPVPGQMFTVNENNFTEFLVVAGVKGTDNDDGNNADIRYSIKETASNQDWKYFSIDRTTGDVILRQALDYERQRKYQLTAQVCDLGIPPLCSEVEFSIVVVDVDDNCPFFERSEDFMSEMKISEDARVGAVVGSFLTAVDKDSQAANVRTCYQLIDSSDGLFKLASRNSTTLVTSGILNRELESGHNLLIVVDDCFGNRLCHSKPRGAKNNFGGTNEQRELYDPKNSSMLQIKVVVEDINDEWPIFSQRLFRGGVKYDTKIGTRVTRIRATDIDKVDEKQLRFYISSVIRPKFGADSRLPKFTRRQAFILNKTTGDISTNIVFQPAWKGAFEFEVMVNDTKGYSDKANVSIKLLGYDQQVELIFETSPNEVWNKATEIIELLSNATNSVATIDDIQQYDARDDKKVFTDHSKALVHFLKPNGKILAPHVALRWLDSPETSTQQDAKKSLITNYRLKYAGENPQPLEKAETDYSLYIIFGGVVGGLLLLVLIIVLLWYVQNNRFKRKLKAATTLAFASSDVATNSALDVPGTNLHASSNPVWGGHYGFDNYAMDYDVQSNGSQNSLDQNAVQMNFHDAITASPSRGQQPSDTVGKNLHNSRTGQKQKTPAGVHHKGSPPPAYEHNPLGYDYASQRGSKGGGMLEVNMNHNFNNQPRSNAGVISPLSRVPTARSEQDRDNMSHTTEVDTHRNRYMIDRNSPLPNFPQSIMSRLESTEL